MQNLTRKLRPKNFDEIVGQDLIRSMLKNSLYAGKIFPSYLFFLVSVVVEKLLQRGFLQLR